MAKQVIVSGIVVPQVNTAEEARAIVAHVKFPPQGVRGQGSAFPAIAFDIDLATYMKTANETIITCVQIESKTAVDNISAICAVPGIGKHLANLLADACMLSQEQQIWCSSVQTT